MPLSNDDQARHAQLANLKQNAPERSRTHGAHSDAKLAPLREQAVIDLRKRFPSADDAEISLLAHRQAQLSVLGEWQDRRGLLANRQRGIPFPAVQLHEKIAAAFEKQYAALAERERARTGARPSYYSLRPGSES